MQAIQTRFHAPTHHKPARIRATSAAGYVTIEFPADAPSDEDAHRVAAQTLADKFGWGAGTTLHGGQLPNGGWVWTMVPDPLPVFVFTYSEQTPKRDTGAGVSKRVSIHRVHPDGTVTDVCTRTDNYVDKDQLVMLALQQAQVLPERAFVAHESGGFALRPRTLREAGIASVVEV